MGRFGGFCVGLVGAWVVLSFLNWAWPTISTVGKALAMVLILATAALVGVPVLAVAGLWALIKGLAGSFDDFFPKKPTAKWILLVLLLPLSAGAWDLPPAKKILDEKINEYRELSKSVNLNLDAGLSTDAVVQFGSLPLQPYEPPVVEFTYEMPTSKKGVIYSAVIEANQQPILRIDQDGDIFLRGKWVGWDGRLKRLSWQ